MPSAQCAPARNRRAVAKLETRAGGPLDTRIGIATGLVVVGELVGQGSAQEQAVVGDTPNLAARLQGVAEPRHANFLLLIAPNLITFSAGAAAALA